MAIFDVSFFRHTYFLSFALQKVIVCRISSVTWNEVQDFTELGQDK